MRSCDINVKGLWENLRLRNHGTVYFVDGFNGSDVVGDGFTPANAFQSIDHALDQCVSGNDDYIFCWNLWHQDTFPIEVDRNAVHIIGIAGPQGYAGMAPSTDVATFNFAQSAGNSSEIAGFALGGTGAPSTHACIELQGDNNNVWIHDCSFGHLWAGDPPVTIQDGIRILGPDVIHGGIIENCWFHGSTVGCGRIERCGIYAHWWTLGTIRNNYFLKCPGITIVANEVGGAIYLLDGDQVSIIHNKIGIADDTANGNGIYLAVGCNGCLVAENEANRGVVTDTSNPFVDIHAGDFNDWMCNQVGKAYQDPETSIL